MEIGHKRFDFFHPPIRLLFILAVLFLILGLLIDLFILDQFTAVNFWILSAFYTAEVGVQFILSFFLFTQNKFELGNRNIKWAAAAILCFGIFGLPRIFIQIQEMFPVLFWSRTIGCLIGGALVNVVWLADSPLKSFFFRRLSWVLFAVIVLTTALQFIFADSIPSAIQANGDYEWSFKFLNIIAGGAILAGSFFFIFEAQRDRNRSELLQILFFYIAMFSLTAAFLGLSNRWDFLWWTVHMMRFCVTLIAIYYVLFIFNQALSSSVQSNKKLKKKNRRLSIMNMKIREQQKTLEEQKVKALHSARMASIGQLAGTVAHQINNPLAAIQLNIESLLSRAKSGEPLTSAFADRMEKVEKLTTRISEIVKGLLKLSREGEMDLIRKAALREIVDNALNICEKKFEDGQVHLQVDPIPDIFVNCRVVQISQVVLNLLLNAFDAVLPLEEKWVRLEFAESEKTAILKVVDSGLGISSKIADQIMEPFFTTKEVNKGTGLGLSISKSLIEEHQGRLYYDPQSLNTCFVVELPRAQ